eukprot:3760344-Rhodomonas_salina.1
MQHNTGGGREGGIREMQECVRVRHHAARADAHCRLASQPKVIAVSHHIRAKPLSLPILLTSCVSSIAAAAFLGHGPFLRKPTDTPHQPTTKPCWPHVTLSQPAHSCHPNRRLCTAKSNPRALLFSSMCMENALISRIAPRRFYALLDELQDEADKLMDKGISGPKSAAKSMTKPHVPATKWTEKAGPCL